MLQVPEEALEKAMAGLIDLDLGLPVLGVASAALHLLREDRARREEEALELLEEQPFLCDADDYEVADIGPGVPQDHPHEEPAAPPRGAILAPCPPRDVGVQVEPLTGPITSKPQLCRAGRGPNGGPGLGPRRSPEEDRGI